LDGSNNTITVTDPAGNENTSSSVATLVVDDDAPATGTADLIAGSDSGLLSTDNATNDNTPTIELQCTEVGEVLRLYTSVPSTTLIGTETCTTAPSTVQITPATALADAVHNITYTSEDSLGNLSDPSSPLVLTVDTDLPLLGVSVVTTGVVSGTNLDVNTPNLPFNVRDVLSGFERVEIDYQLDNGVPGESGTTTTITVDASDLSSTTGVTTILNGAQLLNLDPDVDLDATPHVVTFRLYDVAGNVETAVLRFPPTITFTAGTTLSNSTITDTVFEITSPTTAPIDNIDLSNSTAAFTNLVCVGGNTAGNSDGTDNVGPVYDQVVRCTVDVTSSGTLLVEARDTNNNAVGQNQTSLIIDNTGASITFTDDVDASPVQSDAVVVTVSDTNGIGLLEYKVIAGGSTCGQADFDADTDASTSFNSGDTLFTQTDTSLNGQQVCVKATDAAGNISYQASANTLNIDVTAPNDPTVTALSPNPAQTGTTGQVQQ